MAVVSNRQLKAVEGFFYEPDISLFRLLLSETSRLVPGGHVAELGVYKGRSALLLGQYITGGETLTVVDLFEDHAPHEANQSEVDREYAGLTRASFERAFMEAHGYLPHVIEGPSTLIVEHAPVEPHRLVHVDASHLYRNVVEDMDSAKRLLAGRGGVVILDDYRSEHTPGVAAAIWREVAMGGLHPFVLTPQKLYATWGDPAPYSQVVEAWLRGSAYPSEKQLVGEDDVIRIEAHMGHPARRWLPPVLLPAARRVRERARGLRRHS